MNIMIDCTKDMRRGCGRIGIAILLYVLTETIASSAFLEAGMLVFHRQLNTIDYMIINDVSAYLIGGLVLWLILRPLPKTAPHNRRSLAARETIRLIFESVGLMLSINLLTQIIISGLTDLFGQDMNNLLDTMISDMDVDVMFFFVVLVAPVLEEIIFRRILLRRLLPFGERFAAVMCGLAFGLFHLNLYQFFYAAALGWFFACVVIKTGKLRYTIGLHMLINFIGSVLPTALEEYEIALNIFYVVLIACAILGIVFLFCHIKDLIPRQPSLCGCWTAALTSPCMLLCVIILLFISVIITMLV